MADLQRTTIDVPLYASMTSSADPAIIDVGAQALVENARYFTNGQTQKRYGLTSLPKLDSTGNTIEQGRQVLAVGASLYMHDGNNLFIWNQQNNTWILLGGLNSAVVQNTVLAQSRNDVEQISSASTPAATCIAWVENGQILASVYDPSSATFYQTATVIAYSGTAPNVVSVNGDFLIVYVDIPSSALNIMRIPAANLSNVGDYVAVTTALNFAFYDVCVTSDQRICVVTSESISSTAKVYFRFFDNLLNLLSGTASISWPVQAVSCWPTTDADVGVGTFGGFFSYEDVSIGTGYTYQGWPASITSGISTQFPNGPYTLRVTGYGPRNQCQIWVETNSTSTSVDTSGNTVVNNTQVYLHRAIIDFTKFDVNSNPAHYIDTSISYFTNPNCYLASRAFFADGFAYVWVLADFKLQSQLILLDFKGRLVGRALTDGGAAPFDTQRQSLPYISATTDYYGSTNYFFAARRRAQLKFDANGNASTSIGAALINLEYNDPQVQGVSVGGVTYFGGAAPKLYDGRALSEMGFWFYSDTPVLTEAASAGNLSAGSYEYAAGFGWYDNTGKLWRSPILLIPTNTTGQPNGSSGAQLDVLQNAAVTLSNLTYLQGSEKDGVFIELYRTGVNLAELYKIAQIDNVDQLNMLATTYTDQLADTALSGEVCYTDGSVPPYLSPPGIAYLAATPNRLYGLVSETSEVWVTNLASATASAQFVLGQTLNVPAINPPVNCLEIMDGGLYLFSPNTILVTNADGAALTTGLLQFTPPRALPTDAGCTSPGSLLRNDQGIYYQSTGGINLMNRLQQFSYVGETVKNYQDAINSSMSLPQQQQLRFVSPAQSVIYDYVFQRWSVYTGQSAISACAWQGQYAMVTADGTVKLENVGQFTDDNVHYTRRLITPWVKPAGINGYARTWRFVILGQAKDPNHTLQVRIAYQYDETYVDTLQIQGTAVNPNGVYGGGLGNYGATKAGVYGALPAAQAFQFEAVMPRQKATSFKFEITDINNAGTGECAALTVLTLLCGVYDGGARLPASKRFG